MCKEGDINHSLLVMKLLPVHVDKYVLKNAVCCFKHNNLWSYMHCQYNLPRRGVCMCVYQQIVLMSFLFLCFVAHYEFI